MSFWQEVAPQGAEFLRSVYFLPPNPESPLLPSSWRKKAGVLQWKLLETFPFEQITQPRRDSSVSCVSTAGKTLSAEHLCRLLIYIADDTQAGVHLAKRACGTGKSGLSAPQHGSRPCETEQKPGGPEAATFHQTFPLCLEIMLLLSGGWENICLRH